MSKYLYVLSAKGKMISLSCPIKPGENHYLSISQKMVDEKIPHEVPDNAFYHDAINQGLLTIDHSEDAPKRWKVFNGDHSKEIKATEKKAKAERIARLEAMKAKQDAKAASTKEEVGA